MHNKPTRTIQEAWLAFLGCDEPEKTNDKGAGEGKVMKRRKRVSRAYTYEKVAPEDIIKLLGLFHAENVFLEIVNLKKNSSFYKSMQNEKNKCVIFPNVSSNEYADIFIPGCSGEGVAGMLDEIMESAPEILLFYLTDLPLEDFLNYDRKASGDKIIAEQICVCVFEVMLEESTFLISFPSDLPHQSDMLTKLDEVFRNI